MSSEKLIYRVDQPHGPGEVYVSWQRGSGNYLAMTGYDQTVSIIDRYGQQQARIKLPGLCSGLGWDIDGDILAVIAAGSSQLFLWDANSRRQQVIDVGLRDSMSWIGWTKTGTVLAAATVRGNLAIYNHHTSKRIPIFGKHTKKVTCGSWNSENLLALGSEDRTLSISNVDGDTLRVISLRSDPADIQFSEMKGDERVGAENTVSLIVGKKTLYLYNLLDPDNPIELAFQSHYGTIVSYKWFGDGYIIIGFSVGYFIAISTHIKEVGQELFQIRNHKTSLNDVAICTKLNKVASCGDNNIKIYDTNNLQNSTGIVINVEHEIETEHIEWSDDGQILAVCGRSGSVYLYLTQIQSMSAVYGTRVALLIGLIDIALYQYVKNEKQIKKLSLSIKSEIEPSYISLGPYHLVCGMNNHAWFYDLTKQQQSQLQQITNNNMLLLLNNNNNNNNLLQDEPQPLLIKDREYLSAIKSIKLNVEYASALYDGKIQLHLIEQNDTSNDRDSKIFPESTKQNIMITDHALTPEFLIYCSDMGHINYFFLEDWKMSIEYKHVIGIKNIFIDPGGTRLVFIDDKSQGYLYNPVINQVTIINELAPTVLGIIWDSYPLNRNIFISYDENEICTFIYTKQSVIGSTVEKVGSMRIVSQQVPLLLLNDEITATNSNGQLITFPLCTSDNASNIKQEGALPSLEQTLDKQLKLQKYDEAWQTCVTLNRKNCWIQLADAAMNNLEIELAIRVYAHIENVGMVWTLTELLDIDNWYELAGHVCLILGDYDAAQRWFLMVTTGGSGGINHGAKIALNMRRDLLQWDEALRLARQYAPDEVPAIAREFALQLEFTGNYAEALNHYEKGIQDYKLNHSPITSTEHITQCMNGIARNSIRCGNYTKGFNIAVENDNQQLQKECADILEQKKQYPEAAILYEKCKQFDKAASMYIKLKNWKKVGEFMEYVQSPKIHLLYAKAKESEGKYEDAVQAYQLAKDYTSVVRLQLEKLNNPEVAVEIVQETKSTEGAKMVAEFFQRLNEYSSAIRFLVLSGCFDEAFQMARKHNKLEMYGDILIQTLDTDHKRQDDFKSLALYFENERNYLLAGKYFYHARLFDKSMQYLLKAAKSLNDEAEALNLAIDVVATSNNDNLSNELIEFLLGEHDGLPKDPKFLFRLYMARKQYREAAKTAIIIANEEQMNGNYRNAHDVLFSMYQELKRNKIKIPLEMQNNLMLLHSYILVRIHVRRGDHLKGARMLIRVANNISKFPSHIVPILTSTVIECHRSNMKKYAFEYATMLMGSQYRAQIDPKYVKKIEAVVRKPPKGTYDEEREPTSPCPYCDYKIIETEINCTQCKSVIPFCIATGKHIVKDDLTACPNCDFPAIRTELIQLIESEGVCPMCSEKVDPRSLRKIDDDEEYLNLNDVPS
ncbi:WD repeat-containing protein 19 [Chrysoperla carnea]|uniref:WD repeat-containing protein 19 n=1 Tax=Chrysoperla carnea TaxID=189513 RepID=UPI001D076C49|nr:WD repeat-containing protein 19 [Chrysoperla carnea]